MSTGIRLIMPTREVLETLEPFLLHVDASKMAVCFRNIMSNAFKFTPCGGSITVKLSTLDATDLEVPRPPEENTSVFPMKFPFLYMVLNFFSRFCFSPLKVELSERVNDDMIMMVSAKKYLKVLYTLYALLYPIYPVCPIIPYIPCMPY